MSIYYTKFLITFYKSKPVHNNMKMYSVKTIWKTISELCISDKLYKYYILCISQHFFFEIFNIILRK